MKLLIIIFCTIMFSSCYTQVDLDHFRHSYNPNEIPDSIAFIPDADFKLAGGTISDLTHKFWQRAREEETAVEQIFRLYHRPKATSGPSNDESYYFKENGNCSYMNSSAPIRDQSMQIRWRLLNSNPNILLMYTVSAKIYRKIRIEELSSDYLKIVVLE